MGQALRSTIPASRLEALQSRHAAIETELSEYQKSFAVSDQYLKELKLKKLHLKEEMESLRQAS